MNNDLHIDLNFSPQMAKLLMEMLSKRLESCSMRLGALDTERNLIVSEEDYLNKKIQHISAWIQNHSEANQIEAPQNTPPPVPGIVEIDELKERIDRAGAPLLKTHNVVHTDAITSSLWKSLQASGSEVIFLDHSAPVLVPTPGGMNGILIELDGGIHAVLTVEIAKAFRGSVFRTGMQANNPGDIVIIEGKSGREGGVAYNISDNAPQQEHRFIICPLCVNKINIPKTYLVLGSSAKRPTVVTGKIKVRSLENREVPFVAFIHCNECRQAFVILNGKIHEVTKEEHFMPGHA